MFSRRKLLATAPLAGLAALIPFANAKEAVLPLAWDNMTTEGQTAALTLAGEIGNTGDLGVQGEPGMDYQAMKGNDPCRVMAPSVGIPMWFQDRMPELPTQCSKIIWENLSDYTKSKCIINEDSKNTFKHSGQKFNVSGSDHPFQYGNLDEYYTSFLLDFNKDVGNEREFFDYYLLPALSTLWRPLNEMAPNCDAIHFAPIAPSPYVGHIGAVSNNEVPPVTMRLAYDGYRGCHIMTLSALYGLQWKVHRDNVVMGGEKTFMYRMENGRLRDIITKPSDKWFHMSAEERAEWEPGSPDLDHRILSSNIPFYHESRRSPHHGSAANNS